MNLEEMRRKHAEIMKSANDAAQMAKVLTPEMREKIRGYMAQAEDLAEQIKTVEALNKVNTGAEGLNPVIIKPVPNANGVKGDHKTEYFAAVRNKFNPYNVTPTVQEQVGEDGGYLIPQSVETTVMEALPNVSAIRSIARVERKSGKTAFTYPTSGTSFSWVPENGQIPVTNPQFGIVALDANKAGAIVPVTEEMLRDADFDLEGYLIRSIVNDLAAFEEQAFINGTGSGEPTGLLDDTNGAELGVTVSGTTFDFDDIIDLVNSVDAAYQRNASFVVNPQTVGALRKLKDGSGQYVWQPSAQLGDPPTLYGYPVRVSSAMPTIAPGSKPVLFGDFSNYVVVDRTGIETKVLSELYAGNYQIGIRVTARVDAALTRTDAVKYLKVAGTAATPPSGD